MVIAPSVTVGVTTGGRGVWVKGVSVIVQGVGVYGVAVTVLGVGVTPGQLCPDGSLHTEKVSGVYVRLGDRA